MKNLHALAMSMVLATGALPGVAIATPVLYGSDFAGPASLFNINTATGLATGIAGSSLSDVGDLTSNQVDTLWGVTLNTGNSLVTIDTTTGNVASSVAITGTSANDGGGQITSLAYNPLSGVLYGNTTLSFGDSAGSDDLYTIDPGTGVATLIGRIAFDNVFALGFDQLGSLFGITAGGEFISLSLATGNGSLIASGLGGGLFDIASNPTDNTMFVSQAFSAALATIDTTTGVMTPVGNYVDGTADNIAGLAFVGAVPEPSTLALIGAGLLGFGWRKRAQRVRN